MTSSKEHRIYSLSKRQKSSTLAKELEEKGSLIYKNVEITSLRQLAQILDIKNESTLRSWKGKNWELEEVKKHLQTHGCPSKLHDDQKAELEIYIHGRNDEHEVCSIATIQG